MSSVESWPTNPAKPSDRPGSSRGLGGAGCLGGSGSSGDAGHSRGSLRAREPGGSVGAGGSERSGGPGCLGGHGSSRALKPLGVLVALEALGGGSAYRLQVRYVTS